MPQISLYIDEATLKKVEQEAKREHLSISKWVSEQIKSNIDHKYPSNFEDLYGSLGAEPIQRQDQLSFGNDTPRESL